MSKNTEPPITYQEAFEKYLGTVKEVMAKMLPMKCNACVGEFLSLDRFLNTSKKYISSAS